MIDIRTAARKPSELRPVWLNNDDDDGSSNNNNNAKEVIDEQTRVKRVNKEKEREGARSIESLNKCWHNNWPARQEKKTCLN